MRNSTTENTPEFTSIEDDEYGFLEEEEFLEEEKDSNGTFGAELVKQVKKAQEKIQNEMLWAKAKTSLSPPPKNCKYPLLPASECWKVYLVSDWVLDTIGFGDAQPIKYYYSDLVQGSVWEKRYDYLTGLIIPDADIYLHPGTWLSAFPANYFPQEMSTTEHDCCGLTQLNMICTLPGSGGSHGKKILIPNGQSSTIIKTIPEETPLKYKWMISSSPAGVGKWGSTAFGAGRGKTRFPILFPNRKTPLYMPIPTLPKKTMIRSSAGALAATFYLAEAVLAGHLPTQFDFQSQGAARAAELIEDLRRHIPYYAWLASRACGGELRHHKSLIGRELPGARPNAWEDWQEIHFAYGPAESMLMASEIFLDFGGSGNGGFGGPKWSNSALLLRSYFLGEITDLQFLDRLTNLYHNGGNLLDKFPGSGATSLKQVGPAHSADPPDWRHLRILAGKDVCAFLGVQIENSDHKMMQPGRGITSMFQLLGLMKPVEERLQPMAQLIDLVLKGELNHLLQKVPQPGWAALLDPTGTRVWPCSEPGLHIINQYMDSSEGFSISKDDETINPWFMVWLHDKTIDQVAKEFCKYTDVKPSDTGHSGLGQGWITFTVRNDRKEVQF